VQVQLCFRKLTDESVRGTVNCCGHASDCRFLRGDLRGSGQPTPCDFFRYNSLFSLSKLRESA
jgi:hypothetical protein